MAVTDGYIIDDVYDHVCGQLSQWSNIINKGDRKYRIITKKLYISVNIIFVRFRAI